jgi:copper(I)-binding protein
MPRIICFLNLQEWAEIMIRRYRLGALHSHSAKSPNYGGINRWLTLATSLVMAGLLMSVSVYAGEIQVENAWTRATMPGQDAAGVDLTVTSKHAATLVGVSSPACKSMELHSMTMPRDGGMMKMREVETIALPAGKPVNLRAGGYHLMMTGLKAPLKGDVSVPLILSIREGNKPVMKVKVMVEVKAFNAANPPQREEHSHDD